MLPAVAAVGLEVIFDDTLAPRTDSEAVLILINPDCVQRHGQSVCRGEQQVEDSVSKRTLLWGVLPSIIGILLAGSFELHL